MKRESRFYFLPELAGLLAAIGVVYVFHLNQPLFLAINRVSNFTGSFVWANLTILGDTLVAAVLFFPFIRKRPELVWTALIAAVVTTVLVHSIKPLLDVPRPPAVLDNRLIHIIGPAYHRHSFPSGHTATIFTLAGVFITGFRKPWMLVGLFAAALLVGISRIAVGVHWPGDVLVGAAAGLIGASCGYCFITKLNWREDRIAQLIWGGIFLIATLILLIHFNTHYSEAAIFQRIIALGVLITGGVEYGRLIFDQTHKAGK